LVNKTSLVSPQHKRGLGYT